MELANKLGARFALILGDDEIAAGAYSLKNMQSGEQERVSREGSGGTQGYRKACDQGVEFHWVTEVNRNGKATRFAPETRRFIRRKSLELGLPS